MKHSKIAEHMEEVIQDPTKINVKLKVRQRPVQLTHNTTRCLNGDPPGHPLRRRTLWTWPTARSCSQVGSTISSCLARATTRTCTMASFCARLEPGT